MNFNEVALAEIYDSERLFVEEAREHSFRHEPGTDDAVLDVLLWSRARLTRLSDDRRRSIAESVRSAVEEQRPIRVINNMGGSKSIRATSFPCPGWAEVFHLAFVRQWLLPICSVYEPGVEVQYTGQGGIGSAVDNIPWVHHLAYEDSFADLVEVVGYSLPPNFNVAVKPFNDFYDHDQLAELFDDFSRRPIPKEETTRVESLLAHAEHNFLWAGREDLTRASDKQKSEILRRSVWNLLQWYAYDAVERRDYFSSGVVVSNGVGFRDAYPVRSIRGTDKAFWMAEGVLNTTVDPWRPELRSPDDPDLIGVTRVEAAGRITSVSSHLASVRLLGA